MSEKTYRTVLGIVQFEPRDQEAAGKAVRNVTIRNIGFKEQAVRTYLTLWPSHAGVAVKQGDVVIAEGAYSQGKGEKDGKPVVYHNISVNRIAVLATVDEGTRVETVNDTTDDDASDDDIPF